MSVTTRKCSNCDEWYDARASSCYFCGEEERETNIALKKAVETTRMNSELSKQMSGVRTEMNAESMLTAARQDKSGEAFARARPQVPGYREVVDGIKDSLEEHPEVVDFFYPPEDR